MRSLIPKARFSLSAFGVWRKSLEKFPYYIAYTLEPDAIFIVAIADNRRDPSYWPDRLLEPGR